MKSNKAMRGLLRCENFNVVLDKELKRVSDEGFLEKDECFFLAALLKKETNADFSYFQDCTGYECFINSLHVEDYAKHNHLAQSILFARQVFQAWVSLSLSAPLVSTISVDVDEQCFVIRFHVKREGAQWLDDDMESYSQPTMSIESTEDIDSILKIACSEFGPD